MLKVFSSSISQNFHFGLVYTLPSRSDQRNFRSKLKSKLHLKPEHEFTPLYNEVKNDLFKDQVCNYAEDSGICKATERWAYYRLNRMKTQK